MIIRTQPGMSRNPLGSLRSSPDRLNSPRHCQKGNRLSYWIVTGADESSGQDRSERIYAHSADAAETFAREKGLLVASVTLAPVLAMQSKTAATASTIPDYAGLRAGKTLLMALAVINFGLMVVGLLRIAVSLLTLNSNGFPMGFLIGEALTVTFAFAISGVVLLAASAACAALRDIARNSWR